MSSGPGTSSNLQMRNNKQMPNESPVCGYPSTLPHGHPYAKPYHHPSSQYQTSNSVLPYLHPGGPGMAGKGAHFNVPRTDAGTSKIMQSPHTGMPPTPPISYATTPAHSPPGLPLPTPVIPAMDYLATEIIIAVMGVTGAGKSYFIREVSGISDVEVSSNLHSCTTRVQPYSFHYEGAKITLIDTPGFNDTTRSDTDVLREISAWTSSNYRDKRLLSGIIYLHRITDVRMDGSSLRNLKMFERLCGPGALQNVLLTTTQWANVDQKLGELRERDLQQGDFWGGLIAQGASLERFLGTGESGLELIKKLMKNERKALGIQEQMVEREMKLVETDAGKFMNEELIALTKAFREHLQRLDREHNKALEEKDDEMKEILVQERATARERLEKAVAERELLAELRAAEVRRLKDEERGREEERRKEERRKEEEGERNGRAMIAVRTKDISVARRLLGISKLSRVKGHLIYNIDDPTEFSMDPWDVTIHYKSIFVPASSSSRVAPENPNTGVHAKRYLIYNGAVYLPKYKGSIKRGSGKFFVFSKV